MNFPDIRYMTWAKSLPPARCNLARSGVEACPVALLDLQPRDVVANLPGKYGYRPLRAAIARRYGVAPDQVFAISGGASFANWLACAAVLDGAPASAEVIVERPAYEPLLRIVQAFGCWVRRLDRGFEEKYAVDLERFGALISRRTRLAIVTNLHNPSGVRLDLATLDAMAAMLREVGAHLLVDEVYLECLFGARPRSCVHAGPNVIATNSLTKAYGLDGLRAGWLLGPAAIVRRAEKIHDLLAVNSVAPGEQVSLRAFRRLATIRMRAQSLLDRNLQQIKAYLVRERRLRAVLPPGGTVVFPRLPDGVDADALAARLRDRYSTLIVPGRFFEAPRHVRLSFGCRPGVLARGLRNVTRALDELGITSRWTNHGGLPAVTVRRSPAGAAGRR